MFPTFQHFHLSMFPFFYMLENLFHCLFPVEKSECYFSETEWEIIWKCLQGLFQREKSFAGRRKQIFFQYPSCISKTESWSWNVWSTNVCSYFFLLPILLNKFDSDFGINVQIVVTGLIWNRLNLNLTLYNVPPMVFSWDFDIWSLVVFAEPSLSVCDLNSRSFNIDWWTNIVIKNTQTDCACNLLIEWARSLHDVT